MIRFLSSILFLFLMPNSVWANQESEFQLYVRTGVIEGSYDGTFEGNFTVNLALDIGGEYFVAPDGSVLARFILALDSPDSVPFYTYTGSGFRHYFEGRGPSSEQSDGTLSISLRPKLRTYIAGEIGIAQVIVKSFGPVVQSVASLVEFGVNTGAIYQISNKLGLEAQIGGTLGYGVSSTSVSGSTLRALAGITYFY